MEQPSREPIGPLHDPVTWYGINYAGTQVTQWDFQNKGTRTSPARLFFVLKVPLCNLRPSIINSVPCDRIMHRVYCLPNAHGNDLQTDNARFKGQANAHREVRETWGRGKTGKGRHSNPWENARVAYGKYVRGV